MNAEESGALDESMAERLAACDEALALGTPPADATGPAAAPELQPRLARDLACLQLLENVWPRHTPAAPTRLGRFAIQRELGRGGYGIVYLAHDTHLGREVALKVPRSEVLLSPELRQRFRHEARAAAALEHPNLVPVYEAGEDGDRCWIAAAYCAGLTLAQWLKLQTGPIPERDVAELVAALADGVQHAHSRGVLHRDLKPANVLLATVDSQLSDARGWQQRGTDSGQRTIPKITDFGLAKVLAENADQTHSGDIVGTPAYMAPEQAEGKTQAIGTAADVYALGAILYELLTGRPPFQGATVLAVLEEVSAREPVAPRQFRPGLSRDLETICLKCLEKRPERRYLSANALAEDLKRFQADEPVLARPVGRVERLARAARRRPVVAGLLAAFLTASAVGFVGVLWQWREARRQEGLARQERDEAEKNFRQALLTVDRYCTQVSQELLLHEPGMQPLRRRLLETAREFYQNFTEQHGDDAALRDELARASFRLGMITRDVGSSQDALPLLERARLQFDELLRENPANPTYRHSLAITWENLGSVHEDMGRTAEAEAAYRRALELEESLVRDCADDALYRNAIGLLLSKLSSLLRAGGRLAEAEATRKACLTIQERLFSEDPANSHYRVNLGFSWNNLANLHRSLERITEAEIAYRKAADVWDALVRERPNAPTFRCQLALTQSNLGLMYTESERTPEGLPLLQQALLNREQLARDSPNVPLYQRDVASSHTELGSVYTGLDRTADARAAFEKALEILERLRSAQPINRDYRNKSAQAWQGLGNLFRKTGETMRAEVAYRNALTSSEELSRSYPTIPAYHRDCAKTYNQLGELFHDTGQLTQAETAHQDARAAWERLVSAHPAVASYQRGLARSWYELARVCACRASARDATRTTDVQSRADAESQAARAVESLLKAQAAGHFRDAAHVESFRRERDFDLLRPRDDFQRASRALEAKTPAKP